MKRPVAGERKQLTKLWCGVRKLGNFQHPMSELQTVRLKAQTIKEQAPLHCDCLGGTSFMSLGQLGDLDETAHFADLFEPQAVSPCLQSPCHLSQILSRTRDQLHPHGPTAEDEPPLRRPQADPAPLTVSHHALDACRPERVRTIHENLAQGETQLSSDGLQRSGQAAGRRQVRIQGRVGRKWLMPGRGRRVRGHRCSLPLVPRNPHVREIDQADHALRLKEKPAGQRRVL